MGGCLFISLDGKKQLAFPPATATAISRTVAHLLAGGATGTLIVPLAPWSSWRFLLRPRDSWAPFITVARQLGSPASCLHLPPRYRDLFRGCALYALRVDGRLATSVTHARGSS